MIVECHQQCDACYNCLHRGECHWDSERQCMVREENTKLKPCPFCGAKAMLVYCIHGVGANWGVECTETHAHRMEFSGTQNEIIKEWNRRVIE